MKKHAPSFPAPPGLSLKREILFLLLGVLVAFFDSLRFFARYREAAQDMYLYRAGGQKMLNPAFIMPDFATLLPGCFRAFLVIGIFALLFSVVHYLSFSSGGSHALLLVRRLPDRLYLPRVCLTFPVLAALGVLLCALLLLFVYFGLYMLMTPADCLTPGQFMKLWSLL